MNLSNPTPIKSNEKKTSIFGKIWAGLNLIALMGDFIIPKKQKDNLPIKVRNFIIVFLFLLIAYFIASGILMNVQWIVQEVKKISFSFGDSFYYFGIIIIVFTIVNYFNIDNVLIDFANKNKVIPNAVKDIKSNASIGDAIKNIVGEHKSNSVLYSIIGTINFFWVICGAIFYDRIFFMLMLSLTFIFNVGVIPIKNISLVKKILIAEIILDVLLVAGFLINHFYIS